MRISTTTLESFRLFEQPDTDWMTEAELMATIRGQFTGNRKVHIGQAFGRVLEHPDRYRVPGGYRVPIRGTEEFIELGDEVMSAPLALIVPGSVFEAKGVRRYGAHDVVAKADQMTGARIIETKATLGTFDFHKYADGCQWRFMADIFQPRAITYHVFVLDEDEANGVIRLKATESFNLFPYPELHQDCRDLVSRFVEYVRWRGLDVVLEQRQAEAA